MDPLAVPVEEVLKDGGPGDRFDDFVDHSAGRDVCVTEADGEGHGLAAVGLRGRVGGGTGVDAPGADAEGGEAR